MKKCPAIAGHFCSSKGIDRSKDPTAILNLVTSKIGIVISLSMHGMHGMHAYTTARAAATRPSFAAGAASASPTGLLTTVPGGLSVSSGVVVASVHVQL